jgi:hypothetical protein
MVDSYTKSVVDSWINQYRGGRSADDANWENDKAFYLDWINRYSDSAYSQLFEHANNYFSSEKDKKRKQETDEAAQAQQEQNDYYNGLISEMSKMLNDQQTQANEQYNSQLTALQQQASDTAAQQQAQLEQQNQYYQSLITELSKPKLTTFNPKFYTPDMQTMDSSFEQALKTYNEGNQKSDEYVKDTYGDDTYSGLISQYQRQREELDKQWNSQSEIQGGDVTETEYASRYQSMTDFNNAVQGQYQGLMSTISQLGSLGTELYNRGQSRRGEMVQSRLTERANYFSRQPEISASRLGASIERKQAGAINRQRQRTAGSSGLLSSY